MPDPVAPPILRAEERRRGEKYFSDAEIEEQFDLGYHLKHVDTIFKRVFGKA